MKILLGQQKFFLAIAFIALFTVGSVFADGGQDSGGGPSVICRNDKNQIKSAELLDLEEGAVRFGIHVIPSASSAATHLKTAFERLANYDWYLASDVEDALASVESKVAFLPKGYVMAPGVDLGDSYAAIIPDGCELDYVGYYESDGTLRISTDIWNKLDETNRAALFMHEALYKVARTIGWQHNSLLTRKVNAYLYSTESTLSAVSEDVKSFAWQAGSVSADGCEFNGDCTTLAPVLVTTFDEAVHVQITLVSPSIPGFTGTAFLGAATDSGSTVGEPLTGNMTQLGATPGVIDLSAQPYHFFSLQMETYDGLGTFDITVQGANGKIAESQVTTKGSPTNGTNGSANLFVTIYLNRKLAAPLNLPII